VLVPNQRPGHVRKLLLLLIKNGIKKMKQNFVVIYGMLDGKGLLADYFYSEEEAKAVMVNLDDDERDTILLVDVDTAGISNFWGEVVQATKQEADT
jgi:hypothetical protein